MKNLAAILVAVENVLEVHGTLERPVHAIRYDSREVEPGDAYIAVNGRDDKAVQFIPQALAAGATTIVVEPDDAHHAGSDQVTTIIVPDARLAMAAMSFRLEGNPELGMKLYGITGTNGKTTTAFVLQQLLEACGERTGLIGTLGRVTTDVVATGYTTPEAPELARILREMEESGYTSVAMEVSSHALALHRVAGLDFRGTLFTNLTHDHLDFHDTFDEYLLCKKLLFDHLTSGRTAVVNSDDVSAERMVRDCHGRILRYGSGNADVRIAEPELSASGSRWKVVLSESLGGGELALATDLVGQFNVSNITGAFALALAEGYEREVLVAAVTRLKAVPGRMESLALANGATAIVDYAHTPDALETVLRTARQILGGGRLTVVFGCGGNRDRTKRPEMGKIASELADRVIVTSDNPRDEDPLEIIGEIVAGFNEPGMLESEPERAAAIEMALEGASRGDLVVIAGKGHEDYQIIGALREHFDDREQVRNWNARYQAEMKGAPLV